MKEKELTLKEAEKIVDTMYQNKFVEAGVDEGNTIHLGNMDNVKFNDLESASILLLRTEISQRSKIERLNNIINKLKERNNKAIEFIEKEDNWIKNIDYKILKTEDLLNILRGE